MVQTDKIRHVIIPGSIKERTIMIDAQGAQPTIFLLEEDDETRRPLVQNLRSYGYHVIVATDEEDALERINEGRVQSDLVLVNLVGKSADEALGVGRRIRAHAKYDGHTPLVVMPEKYGKDVEGTDVNVEGNDWIHYLGEEFDQLQNLLKRLTS
jgi:CheY-like chemotaxis protein